MPLWCPQTSAEDAADFQGVSSSESKMIDVLPSSSYSVPIFSEESRAKVLVLRGRQGSLAGRLMSYSNADAAMTTEDYKTDYEVETAKSQGSEGSKGELQREVASIAILREKQILSQSMTRKPQQCLVYGKLSVMVQEVSEEALAVPLKCPALSDMLENREIYRAIALRSGCEIVFTRRIAVRKMIKWNRFAILLLRGPSVAALHRLRAMLEVANRAFRQAVPYDAERPRPRIRTSEPMPDNLDLAVCSVRTGPAVASWERLPLEMKTKNIIFPNNQPIGPVLSYVYPKWGNQSSKSIPHTVLFETAIDAAMKLEKQQTEEQFADFLVRW